MLTSWLLTLGLLINSGFALIKHDYHKGDEVPLLVSNLSPGGNSESGIFSLYPINYFDDTINFCYADRFIFGDDDKWENGKFDKHDKKSRVFKHDTLFSDDINYGPRTMQLKFKEEQLCGQICWRPYTSINASMINFLIENDYRYNFYLDDMPVGKEFYDYNSNKFYLSNNLPVGYKDVNHVLHFYNHWQFVVYYVNNGLNSYNIIKAVMQQRSTKRVKEYENQCQIYPPMTLRTKKDVDNKVIITYDIIWKELVFDHTVHYDWYNRFDQFKHDLINHKFDLIQNMIYFILVIFMIFFTKNATDSLIHQADVRSYKALNSNDVLIEESLDMEIDWHSLKNDVFRKPGNLKLFCNLIGFGLQFLIVSIIVLGLLIIGNISIVIPNDVKHKFFELYMITSVIQSYVSTTIYKNFHPFFLQANDTISRGQKLYIHKSIVLLNLIFGPLIFVLINTILNFAYKSVNSPKYLDFMILFNLGIKYCFIYVPLSLLGSIYALVISSRNFQNNSVKVNMIEKKIPSSLPFLNRPIIINIITAIFPFTIISNRLDTLWYSILFNNLYFNYWNYMISIALALIVSMSINRLMITNSLNIGNWKWQWLSITNGLMVGVYSFVYGFSVLGWNKFSNKSSLIIFTAQNLLISILIGTGFAAINFYNGWEFIRRLYKTKEQF